MTKQQARKHVFKALSDTLLQDLGNDSGWLWHDRDGKELEQTDIDRVFEAAEDIAAELLQRSLGRRKLK